MSFVLDASVTLTWCFEDQKTEYGQAVLEALGNEQAFVPPIWQLEIINALLGAERKKLLSHTECVGFLNTLATSSIQVSDPVVNSVIFLSTALSYGLSAYDACYLELASQLGLPIASLDKKIRNAAKSAGIELFQP
jgi:predicted nucleic acid-binding protein